MSKPHYLVTGAFGCIGAWVVRNLVREDCLVTALDASLDDHRLRLVCTPAELEKVARIQGNVTDLAALEKVVVEHGITDIIHLAALQVPFCKADPSLGASVNVVGTVNIFEAARRAGLKRVTYASSVGVFGLSEEYSGGEVDDNAQLMPRSFYGVYKQANEGTARIYWWDHQISSVGLRPYVVYGPGRDQGMTSGPTWAMLAAAAGRPYTISYGGRSGFNYVDDIARLFIQSSRADFQGAQVLNVRGSVVEMPEVLNAIARVVPAARTLIQYNPVPLALPEGMVDAHLHEMFPAFTETPLYVGVAQTMELFQQALQDGRLRANQIPS
jgi:UDP-glucuronate 4-epimerase